jgi:hypothetical protein
MSTLDTELLKSIMDGVVSHAQISGQFDAVNTYEPKRSPGSHITAAIWTQSIDPLAGASGLANVTARLLYTVRIYQNMLSEPQDAIDPRVMEATYTLMAAYSNDFTLDGLIRNVDLLGNFGVALAAQAGYIDIDNKMFRVMDISLPLIVNDVWTQNG